jgi:hypothetical protein
VFSLAVLNQSFLMRFVPLRRFFNPRFRGLRRARTQAIMTIVAMRSKNSISRETCWIEGRACPRRYLSVLPSRMRANLFGD